MKGRGDVLFELEWRAYRGYMPHTPRNALISGGVLLALLFACQLFLGSRGTLESHFALGGLAVWLFCLFGSVGPSVMLYENPFKDWWLTMPCARRDLMRAKALANMRSAFILSGAVWLVCALDAVLRAARGVLPNEPEADRLLAAIAAYGLLLAAIAALSVCAGFLVLSLCNGWRLWLLIPLAIFAIMPFVLMQIVAQPNEAVAARLSAGWAAVYALLAIALSALLYRLMLHLAERYGLPALARHRAGGQAFARNGAAIRRERFRTRGGGFRALFGLERARFRSFASHRAARALYAALLALSAVGSYFAASASKNMFGMLMVIVLFAALIPSSIIGTVNQNDANQRRLAWFLAFPYSRRLLLAARLLALWTSWLYWVSGVLLAYGVGIGLRAAFGRVAHPGGHELRMMLLGSLVLLVSGWLCGLLNLAQPLTFRSKAAAWLAVPLAIGANIAPLLIINGMKVWEKGGETVVSHWPLAVLIFLAAAALACAAFEAGTRWMHLYLLNTRETVQRRNLAERR